MDLVRIRKMSETGSLDASTNLEDNVRKNYSVDWHLPYVELRTELINAYQFMERRRLKAVQFKIKDTPLCQFFKGTNSPDQTKGRATAADKKGIT